MIHAIIDILPSQKTECVEWIQYQEANNRTMTRKIRAGVHCLGTNPSS